MKSKINDEMRKNIIKTISEITKIEERELSDGILIREEVGMDSLQAMEIVAKIEKKLNVKIDESKLFDLNTLGEFVDLVRDSKK